MGPNITRRMILLEEYVFRHRRNGFKILLRTPHRRPSDRLRRPGPTTSRSVMQARNRTTLAKAYSPPNSNLTSIRPAMNNAPRLARSSAKASPVQWGCFFCQHARPQPRRVDMPSSLRRKVSSSIPRRAQHQQQHQAANAPSMDQIGAHYKRKNRTVAYVCSR